MEKANRTHLARSESREASEHENQDFVSDQRCAAGQMAFGNDSSVLSIPVPPRTAAEDDRFQERATWQQR
jgi:hypothetical protein